MGKNFRHQPVITTQADSDQNSDHWLREFEDKLIKNSVQPAGNRSIFDQINSIMNGSKSKFSSVQAKVDDMMNRSGMKAHLDSLKTAETASTQKTADCSTKTAQDQSVDANAAKEPASKESKVIVFQKKPSIVKTLNNIIEGSRGNLPIPTIIDRLRSLHNDDIAEASDWEDDELLRYVSDLNLSAKCANQSNYEDFQDLGKTDTSTADSDIDASNADAFNALMPAKI